MAEIGDGPAVAGAAFSCCETTSEELARIYRALGHPARLAIVATLANRSEACCGEIVGELPLAQSTVSQHLQVLKEAGLLVCEARGRSCHYHLNHEALARAELLSAGFLRGAVGAPAPCSKIPPEQNPVQGRINPGEEPQPC